ncbi:thymidylate kinase-like isoform X2 [Biomphalaria glabrata]|uniref:Thymidylate kinase n=1 Tax=Biomphalaria glabrata TaxID=6526 RepID=A0A9W2Z0Y4_BIOGL|nr:thymidylate kinase-like isoform X2 [Biomphalaria glabrata]
MKNYLRSTILVDRLKHLIVQILSSHKVFINYQNTIRMKVSTTPRGSLIVFEGCDRSGKTTQCAKLVESLQAQGEEVKLMKFPDRTTTIGTLINNYLQMSQELDDRVVHLLFSANRWEAIESMKKTLKAGTTLIVDRYAFSGIAYSAAKGLDLEWCRSPDIGLIKPDKVIYLSVNEQIMSERANYGNERYEKIDFQKRVHNIFLQLQEPYWQNVSADGSIDVIHKEINTIVSETIRDSKVKPLLKLWTDGEIL